MEIPFVGGAYQGRSSNVNSQRCVNLFPATDGQQPKNPLILVGTPGTSELASLDWSLLANLLIHYKFNNLGSTLTDLQGNYTGTLVNFPTDNSQWVTGLENTGLQYDSSTPGDHVTFSDSLQSLMASSFTVSMWLKLPDGRPVSDKYFIGSRVNNGGMYHQFMIYLATTGHLTAYYGNSTGGANWTSLDPIFADGAMSAFSHICVTVEQQDSGIQILLYVNGQIPDVNVTLDGYGGSVVMSGWNSVNDMYLGAWNKDAALWNSMDGIMDEVRIYTCAQSASIINTIYNIHA